MSGTFHIIRDEILLGYLPFLEPFIYKSDLCTKAGSGQTQGKFEKKGRCSAYFGTPRRSVDLIVHHNDAVRKTPLFEPFIYIK
jgi:hypothetical protein